MRTLKSSIVAFITGAGALCFVALVGFSAPMWAAEGAESVQDIVAERNFLHGYPAVNGDGTVNVVVECPAGTTAKWQVEPDGVLRRQYKSGELYDLHYLPFLVNYGMIPRTLVAKEVGGEQEQLDIQILGDVIKRGTVVRVRVIGALALLDKGKADDKLVAVVEGSPMGDIRNIDELEKAFPGVTRILEMWWLNFKGQNIMESYGYVGAKSAARLIDAASDGYEKYMADSR